MLLNKLCMPALIYFVYAFTHVFIDTIKGLYNTALIEMGIGLLITLVLNILCEQGLGVVSWLIISIPFILMTSIAALVLFVLKLNPATGKALTPPGKTNESNSSQSPTNSSLLPNPPCHRCQQHHPPDHPCPHHPQCGKCHQYHPPHHSCPQQCGKCHQYHPPTQQCVDTQPIPQPPQPIPQPPQPVPQLSQSVPQSYQPLPQTSQTMTQPYNPILPPVPQPLPQSVPPHNVEPSHPDQLTSHAHKLMPQFKNSPHPNVSPYAFPVSVNIAPFQGSLGNSKRPVSTQ